MDLIYLGRYCSDEILSGPEKVAKRIFKLYSIENKSIFTEYFFDGKKYNVFKKLFGKEIKDNINGSDVYRFGILPLFFTLIKHKPRIIHIITFERFAFVAFIYKIFFRVKIIYSMHGLIVHENNFFRKIKGYYGFKDKITEKILVRYSDILLILSDNFEKILNSYYRAGNNRIRKIKNGIDSKYYSDRDKMFDNNKTLKIVFIADIRREEKGFTFLKETLEKTEMKIELYIVDKKENKDEIIFNNKLINVCCVDKKPPKELADFLIDKDVFISASSYEPFSITCAECMAAGVIPVMTRETGISELIKDGVNGFIFDYGDGKKLTDILSRLNENIELKKNISKEAKAVYNSLNWKNIINDYMNIYKTI